MRGGWLLAGMLLALVACPGCGRSRARATADRVAALVQGDFVGMRESEDRLVARAEGLYAHLDRFDLSVEGLDDEQGGRFGTFNGNAYYLKRAKEGACFYASPGRPPDDRLRRQVKAMTYLEGPLIEAGATGGFVFFGMTKPESVAMMYPFVDVASLFPPGLEFDRFEWYRRGAERPGAANWAARPFTSLVSEWVLDVSRAVSVNGEVKGVVVLNVTLSALVRRRLRDLAEPALLVASDLTVVGASPTGKQALPIPMLEDPGSLKQTRDNAFAADRYRLTDPSQEPGIREIGRRISAGEREFRGQVGGRKLTFVVRPVPEVGFWLVVVTD